MTAPSIFLALRLCPLVLDKRRTLAEAVARSVDKMGPTAIREVRATEVVVVLGEGRSTLVVSEAVGLRLRKRTPEEEEEEEVVVCLAGVAATVVRAASQEEAAVAKEVPISSTVAMETPALSAVMAAPVGRGATVAMAGFLRTTQGIPVPVGSPVVAAEQ